MDWLQHYTACWSLHNVRPLTKTHMADLFTADSAYGSSVLKIYNENGIHDESSGVAALKYWNGSGAARLYEHEDRAILIEYLSGQDLSLSQEFADDYDVLILSDTIARLQKHSAADASGLMPMAKRLNDFAAKIKSDADEIFQNAAAQALELASTQKNLTVLHGDLHHGNLLHDPLRGWVSIDPKGLWGEAAFEAAAPLLGNVKVKNLYDKNVILRRANIFCERLDFDLKRLLTFSFVEACIISHWSQDAGFDRLAIHHRKMAEAVKALIN